MIYIHGDSFYMGSDNYLSQPDERPAQLVAIKSFYLSKYEVTQELWTYVMRFNPSYSKHPNKPVESVSFNDIEIFLKRLNNLTGRYYRLPSEAEWEFAACSRNYSQPYSGSHIIDSVAWYKNNSDEKSHKVGMLSPNSYGLYDLTGNVHEWCSDNYYGTNYKGDSVIQLSNEIHKVFRGGSFYSDIEHCRIKNRNYAVANSRNFSLGFRLAHDVE